jgi:hypothetical protein
MRQFIKYLLLAEAFAVTTFGLGWWAVPLVGALWGLFSTDPRRARNAGVAASAGWLTLLVLDAVRGPVPVMADQLGSVMKVPAVALYAITLLFPALLAWSAAALPPGIRAGAPATDQPA